MAVKGKQGTALAWAIDEHPILIATIMYLVAAVPLFYWLTGFVGIDGQIEAQTAAISLAIGGLMFVPGIMVWLRKKKFELGFAQAQEVKQQMIVDTRDQTGDSDAADRFRTGGSE